MYCDFPKRWFMISILIKFVKSDWIEIPQFTKTHYYSTEEFKTMVLTTTSKYEREFESNFNTTEISDMNETTTENSFTTKNTKEITEQEITTESYDEIESKLTEEDIADNEDKSYPNSTVLPFFTLIQKMLLEGVHKTSSKIKVLRNLKTDLLYEIQRRIGNLFQEPNEDVNLPRDYKEGDHQMEFPSNEGALVTIGFLTFAVFLVKLVLKLIQTLKYKHQYYTMSTMQMMNGMDSMVQSYVGRKRRDASITEEQMRIMDLLNDLKFK